MSSVLILLGICVTALTPTIAIVVTRFLDHRERLEVAARVADTAAAAALVSDKVDVVNETIESVRVETTAKLNEIKILVNGRLSDALKEIKELQATADAALEEISRLRHDAATQAQIVQLLNEKLGGWKPSDPDRRNPPAAA